MSLAVAGATLIIGACVQGSIGFGMNLIAGPIIALVEPSLIPGPLLVSTLAVTVPSVFAEWRGVDLRELGIGSLGRIPGNALGAIAVALLPLRWLTGLVGVSVLAGLALAQLSKRNKSTVDGPVSRPRLLLAAAASGFMGTTATTGGPPMALLYAEHGAAKLRATLSAFFTVGLLFSLGGLAIVGSLGQTQIKDGLALMPFVLLGWAASWLVKPHVGDGDRLRAAVMVISGLAALVLIGQAIG